MTDQIRFVIIIDCAYRIIDIVRFSMSIIKDADMYHSSIIVETTYGSYSHKLPEQYSAISEFSCRKHGKRYLSELIKIINNQKKK